jgi:hypothetical protein
MTERAKLILSIIGLAVTFMTAMGAVVLAIGVINNKLDIGLYDVSGFTVFDDNQIAGTVVKVFLALMFEALMYVFLSLIIKKVATRVLLLLPITILLVVAAYSLSFMLWFTF